VKRVHYFNVYLGTYFDSESTPNQRINDVKYIMMDITFEYCNYSRSQYSAERKSLIADWQRVNRACCELSLLPPSRSYACADRPKRVSHTT